MKSTHVCLFASMILAAPAFGVTADIGAKFGSSTLDVRQVENNQTSHATGASVVVGETFDRMSVGLGGGLTRNVFDSAGDEGVHYDLSAIGVAEYQAGAVNPFLKLDYILLSRGEVDAALDDIDMENSGYELAAGIRWAAARNLSVSLETALSAKKEFEFDFDEFGTADVEYVYGPLDSFSVGMQLRL